MPLPALEPRIQVVQSLLLLLSKLVDHGDPQLSKEGLALRSSVDTDRQVMRVASVSRRTSCDGPHLCDQSAESTCYIMCKRRFIATLLAALWQGGWCCSTWCCSPINHHGSL
jgi:hypothetical protein